MNIFDKALAIAKAEVGYCEKASNSNLDNKTANAGSGNFTKYWRDLLPSYQGQPWCNGFVNWVFRKAYGESAAKKMLYSEKGWSYYTPTSADYFKAAGAWTTKNPKPGYVIYFRNTQRIHHVGIVVAVDANYVYTIEGNTSSSSAVVANGGGVFEKKYLLGNSAIAGYGIPKYDAIGETAKEDYKITKLLSTYDGLEITMDLNVRKTPGKSGECIGYYSKGTVVSATERTSKIDGFYWFKTEKGWISGKYIKGWIKDDNQGVWYYDNGGYPASEWRKIDNIWYYFEKSGYMACNCWVKSLQKEEWYWLEKDGSWNENKTTKTKPVGLILK